MKKNLVLTGMMGVGKSTVGKKLAKKLGLKFVDVDQLIEKKEKVRIKDIFENKGENYFRKVEKQITLDVLKNKNLLIALGGGAFLNSSIRKEIKNSCISFWLDLNLKILSTRLKNVRKRPLLDKDDLEGSINRIYSERKKIYSESDYRIKIKSTKANEVIDKIIKLYENRPN